MVQGSDWDRYWAGRGQAGEAFLGEGVERHPALSTYWSEVFEHHTGAGLIDLAAGAGAVARIAAESGLDVTASDVSGAAMKVLAEKDHRISCHTTSAEQLPYPTASFDMAVSQFGIEYAPPRAFGEAVRVLRPGGTFHFLCHIEGGVIHTEVRGHRRGADALLASGFFDAAKILTAELFGQPGTNGREAYGRAEPLALQSGTPLAQHAIGGFRQMAARFRAYDQKDIFGWLGGMEEEARAYAGRLASMEEAALTEEAAKAAVRALENAGAACEPLAVFRLDPAEAPAAWVIKGTCKRG